MTKKLENMTKRELIREIDAFKITQYQQHKTIKTLEGVLLERDNMLIEISNIMGRQNFNDMVELIKTEKEKV